MDQVIEIISFYEFKNMASVGPLPEVRASLRQLLAEHEVRGTIILAAEGFNGMVCGSQAGIANFTRDAQAILQTQLAIKSSLNNTAPFRRLDVKIKPEIVTLKQPVNIDLRHGTHVKPSEWNQLISDPETLLLDARNDYEYQTGTFKHAINPGVARFSQLPAYIAEHFDPAVHKRVAMFCTGGIRCEKFAPYMKGLGFEDVYQLEGGILKYLEEVAAEESLWEGECFVFDERVSVTSDLSKGASADLSQRLDKRTNPLYKTCE